MSRLKNGTIPSYRLHKARNCAVVTIAGHNHYLDPFGSPSKQAEICGPHPRLGEGPGSAEARRGNATDTQ